MTTRAELWYRLRLRMRRFRRTTVTGPLLEALRVYGVLRHMQGVLLHARVLGPEEFGPHVRVLRPFNPERGLPETEAFDYVIARQEHLSELDRRSLVALQTAYRCLYANAGFVLFGTVSGPAASVDTGPPETAAVAAVQFRITELTRAAPGGEARPPSRATVRDRAVLVTTFNRPAALERSLPQLMALGHEVVVVDDGSIGVAAERNRVTCREAGALYLPMPANRGLAAALNVGFGFLLADRSLRWISYFQDDVDLDPHVMDRMRSLEHDSLRPILTGYDADEHPAEREEEIAGIRVKLKRSSPAVHLHAHVGYWSGVLPVPTEYLGAPRRRWEASLEDYWIVNGAPASAERRGLLVTCVPGLVRTFLWHHADSTWGNPNQPDPPLAPPTAD